MCPIFDKDRILIADLDELVPESSQDIKDLFLRDIRAP